MSMLTKEMGAVQVKAMGQYIVIPQKSEYKPPFIKEKLDYPTVEAYLEEVFNPAGTDEALPKNISKNN